MCFASKPPPRHLPGTLGHKVIPHAINHARCHPDGRPTTRPILQRLGAREAHGRRAGGCLLYTSDAADDM
eukprot:8898709-Alexandrium_andersonii.AAC.1